MEKESVTGLRPLEAPQDETAAGAVDATGSRVRSTAWARMDEQFAQTRYDLKKKKAEQDAALAVREEHLVGLIQMAYSRLVDMADVLDKHPNYDCKSFMRATADRLKTGLKVVGLEVA